MPVKDKGSPKPVTVALEAKGEGGMMTKLLSRTTPMPDQLPTASVTAKLGSGPLAPFAAPRN